MHPLVGLVKAAQNLSHAVEEHADAQDRHEQISTRWITDEADQAQTADVEHRTEAERHRHATPRVDPRQRVLAGDRPHQDLGEPEIDGHAEHQDQRERQVQLAVARIPQEPREESQEGQAHGCRDNPRHHQDDRVADDAPDRVRERPSRGMSGVERQSPRRTIPARHDRWSHRIARPRSPSRVPR